MTGTLAQGVLVSDRIGACPYRPFSTSHTTKKHCRWPKCLHCHI